MAASDWFDAKRVIGEHCAREWGADNRMVNYCAERQLEGLSKLQRKEPFTTAEKIARVQCAQKWPGDFNMRAYCEEHD